MLAEKKKREKALIREEKRVLADSCKSCLMGGRGVEGSGGKPLKGGAEKKGLRGEGLQRGILVRDRDGA